LKFGKDIFEHQIAVRKFPPPHKFFDRLLRYGFRNTCDPVVVAVAHGRLRFDFGNAEGFINNNVIVY
jgi:hypothetical protein